MVAPVKLFESFNLTHSSFKLKSHKKHVREKTRFVAVSLSCSIVIVASCLPAGCTKPISSVQKIQQKQDEQQRGAATIDHLREAYRFLSDLAELNREVANQRILSLLNGWLDSNPLPENWQRPDIISTVDLQWESIDPLSGLEQRRFVADDVQHLKMAFLCRSITQWIDPEVSADPLFSQWVESQREVLGTDNANSLHRALQLFDWTVRNIQLEPLVATEMAPPAPDLPFGLEFRGAGYRQTTDQTLFRGMGDQWQRARVFIQLCRQADIDACVLGIPDSDGQNVKEWLVGVLIGEQIFLFEPGLGLPVPGPDQVGIATLAQARSEPSVLRRLTVQGWFDYPIDNSMVQQTVALLDVNPAGLSQRMQHLEQGLVGETRMIVWQDADSIGDRFDNVLGVAGARMWDIPLKARLYSFLMSQLAQDNQQFAIWESIRWGMLGDSFPLAVARWEHLKGDFERLEQEQEPGARVRYMELRHPEFEIEALETNVDLQLQYGVRRTLGQTPEEYQMMIQNIQIYMQMAKRAASYWISLIHYDEGDYQNARNWYEKRVLDEDQASVWVPSAKYNLGRSLERLDAMAEAVELYKTEGVPQEHGNRLRARLLEK